MDFLEMKRQFGGKEPLWLYVGAKDHEALRRLGHGLQRVVPVGAWIGPIVVVLMRLLRWVEGIVGNWGWSIIILTLLIKLAFFHLSATSYKSLARMRKVQPRIVAIRDRKSTRLNSSHSQQSRMPSSA